MTHRRVVANSLEYDFAPDDAPLLAHRDWAIATAQVVDDIAGTPLAVPFRVRVVLPGEQDEVNQAGVRVHRVERAITVKTGPSGTFALVTRPWLRFTPLGGPPSVTVSIEADGFITRSQTFAFLYDQRTIAFPAPGLGGSLVTLNSTAGLSLGQTLLFGPIARPQYARIAAFGGPNQVTLAVGLLEPQVLGDPVFPDAFTSPPPVAIAMRRAPVQIVGRVVNRDTAANVSTPIFNALITVTDFWRTRAAVAANPAKGSMTDPVLALRQFAIALASGALASRAAGATVGSIALPPTAGDDRLLVRPARPGTRRLDVASRQNLLASPAPLPNRLLLIGPADPAASEYQTIGTLQPAGTPAEPAQLGLELPLLHDHASGTRVSRINVGALPPTPHVLSDAAEPGDRCLFLDGVVGLPPAGTVRVTGGGAIDEFQAYTDLTVLSDANGYYRLPPLQRVARVALTIDDGVGNVQVIEADPEYGEPEQRVDAVYFV